MSGSLNKLQKVKINDVVVKPIFVAEPERNTINGYDCIPYLKANIFLCAKKFSGKTTTLFEILKQKAGKNTNIIVVSSTFFNDATWKVIQEYFNKKHIAMIGFKSLKDDEGKNILKDFIDGKQKENEIKEENNEEDEDVFKISDGKIKQISKKKKKYGGKDRKKKPIKPKKPKLQSPDYIFVFDDLSNELRKDVSLKHFISCHRHFNTLNIFSSQYWHHLHPDNRQCMDILILFGGISFDKLQQIHNDLAIQIDFNLFCMLYKDATRERFNFLYVDAANNVFKHNFNQKYFLT